MGAQEQRRPNSPVVLRVYTKPGCHLCVELLEMISTLPHANRLAIEEVNIEQNAALYEKYRYTIPVLELPGGVQLHPPYDEASVALALRSVLQLDANS